MQLATIAFRTFLVVVPALTGCGRHLEPQQPRLTHRQSSAWSRSPHSCRYHCEPYDEHRVDYSWEVKK